MEKERIGRAPSLYPPARRRRRHPEVQFFSELFGRRQEIDERVAHQLPANPHNARYLDTKRDRTGHLLR